MGLESELLPGWAGSGAEAAPGYFQGACSEALGPVGESTGLQRLCSLYLLYLPSLEQPPNPSFRVQFQGKFP